MKKGFAQIIIVGLIFLISLISIAAWAPWVTDNFAKQKVLSTIKPPCEEFKLPKVVYDYKTTFPADVNKFNLKDYFDFGRQTTIVISCPSLSKTPTADTYFVSFIGTVYKLSSHEYTSPQTVKTAETTNWKTYTNQKRGFQISYPSDFKVYEDSSFGIPVFVIEGHERNISAQYSVLTVYYFSKEYLIQYKERQGKDFSESVFRDLKNIKSVNLDGVHAKEGVIEEESLDKPSNTKTYSYIKSIYAENKNNGYSILVEIPFRDEVRLFDQILSTFKFTN